MPTNEDVFSHLKGSSPFIKEINKLLDQASVYKSIIKTPDDLLENLVIKLFHYANDYQNDPAKSIIKTPNNNWLEDLVNKLFHCANDPQNESAKNKLYVIFGENENFPASIMYCAALMKEDETYKVQKFVAYDPKTKTRGGFQLQTVSIWMDVWKKFIFERTYYPGRINKYMSIIPIEQLKKLTNSKAVDTPSTENKVTVSRPTVSNPIYRLFADHEKENETLEKDNKPVTTPQKLIWV